MLQIKLLISSFGHKHGKPNDPKADVILNARKVKNPVREAGTRSGLNSKVAEIVFSDPKAQGLVDQGLELVEVFVTQQKVDHADAKEDVQVFYHIAVGCLGGQHRSVAIADKLGKELASLGHDVETRHFHLK